ncbi:hypothetical protein V6N11_057243 [Hibiscus sabdariffa]|uniref:Uncharacterized protein n=1 Tax=Hibiscus sabdariffa TaxID=183260 RepID=A0ABR2NKK6_9ROSI
MTRVTQRNNRRMRTSLIIHAALPVSRNHEGQGDIEQDPMVASVEEETNIPAAVEEGQETAMPAAVEEGQ